jgi:hypothetical protein
MVRLCSKSSRPYFPIPTRDSPSPSVAMGAAVSNGHRRVAGVSRGRSTEGNEPGKPGRPHNSGRAELGRQTRPLTVLFRSFEADRLSYRAAAVVAEKECCVIPQGLSGTAGRGPACPVVWEAGGATLPPTRLGGIFIRYPNQVGDGN